MTTIVTPLPAALEQAGFFAAIDVALGSFLGDGDELVAFGAALASRCLRQGHVCAPLGIPAIYPTPEQAPAVPLPEPEALIAALRKSLSVDVGRVVLGTARPLVLDEQDRLYLSRYYDHEQHLARALMDLCARSSPADSSPVPISLDDPEQQRALEAALSFGLSVISGGPGTGKTFTVVRLLEAWFRRAHLAGQAAPRVLLLAPTGKAAARLSESIRASKQKLGIDPGAVLPEQASTIHRALGVPHEGGPPRRGPGSPLDADIVVVDEASMIDLSLMRALVDALGPYASLVLLGDPDQLASVEAGNVLGELCDVLSRETQLGPALVTLTKSHRFEPGTALGEISRAARAGDSEEVLALLSGEHAELEHVPDLLPAKSTRLEQLLLAWFRELLRAPDVNQALTLAKELRVLCAHRTGPFGVEDVNDVVCSWLLRARLVRAGTEHYQGRLVMITENDPVLDLYNGDVGLFWPDEQDRLMVFFERPGRAPLALFPGYLPAHETGFAITIHKSQGSEFEHAAIVLPQASSPLLCRELLYTAMTRARARVTLVGDADALRVGLGRKVVRFSGLSDALTLAAQGCGLGLSTKAISR